jgi:hypothetical protein
VSVVEKTDPSSLICTPTVPTGDDFVEEFESSCGFLIGHLLGFCRSAFDVDPVYELVKPLCGDWGLMGKAQTGWGTALSTNTLDVWEGEAADAFRAQMVTLGQNYATYSEGCDLIGELTGSLIEVAKSAALGIATLISFLSDILERLVVEASVPVVGWLVGAADIAIHIRSFWSKFDRAITLLRKVLDAIEKAVDAIYAVINIMHAIKVALATVAGTAAAINATHMDGAARNQFGV